MNILLPEGPAGGIVQAAFHSAPDVLRALGVDDRLGLSSQEVSRRQARYGPNAVASHHARLLLVLWYQLRSPLLGLLLVAAASYFVGERSDAVIIAVIVLVRWVWASSTSIAPRRPVCA